MTEPLWNDEQLIQAINGTSEERNDAMRYIFKNLEWRSMVVQYVQHKGGNEPDGEDVFQEAIILFDRNLRQGKFKGGSSLKTYFYGIVKWYWLGQIRKKRTLEELASLGEPGQDEGVEARVINTEKAEYLQKALDQIGKRCKTILNLYGRRYSMDEIAAELGLAHGKVAKKAAYRCRMKLSAFFDRHPEWVQYVS